MLAVCWWLHWSREQNLDWYSDQYLSTSWWWRRVDSGNDKWIYRFQHNHYVKVLLLQYVIRPFAPAPKKPANTNLYQAFAADGSIISIPLRVKWLKGFLAALAPINSSVNATSSSIVDRWYDHHPFTVICHLSQKWPQEFKEHWNIGESAFVCLYTLKETLENVSQNSVFQHISDTTNVMMSEVTNVTE